jgi:hypothetical protein
MPFPRQTARSFKKSKIEALIPGQIGCYGLLRGGVWVYIGKGDIRTRLLEHLNDDNPCITSQRPSHWVYVVTDDCDEREKQLIQEYGPICNKLAG